MVPRDWSQGQHFYHKFIQSYIYCKKFSFEKKTRLLGDTLEGLSPYQEFQFPQDTFHGKNQPWFSFESVTHKLESKKCKNVNFAIVMLGDCSSGEHGK